ncbi:hypothetical protein BJF83_08480 [Nocardiopsis sp. CNR-923]|uniref:SAM-dependent methyltransferase n=1 Tax=Nocardiopsis sp. CNR-923 TaxID=1904965 RepID=UPI000963CC8C|nr:class I SAM-dependent methyltransferase [Nocardiopsis sp. CNR-923]OLT30334.1 hypothetical protein BJF83_08480 [Nocardiopsis sp. CNR-923]
MVNTPTDLARRVEELTDGVWILAALAAAAGDGPPDGAELSDEHGALLAHAGLAEHGPDGWRLLPAHRAALDRQADPSAFARRVARQLRQAADAVEDRPAPPEDDAAFVAEGVASGARVGSFLDLLAASVPGFAPVLRTSGLSVLDVGTGIGAVAATVLDRVPGSRAVGLDTDPRALRLAEEHLAGLGVRDRVDLRLLDVADLTVDDVFDLAWLPVSVLSPDAADTALRRVHSALRPGAWLVSATAVGPNGDGGTRDAVLRWRMARSGVAPWPPEEVRRRLVAAGYRGVTPVPTPGRAVTLVVARRA